MQVQAMLENFSGLYRIQRYLEGLYRMCVPDVEAQLVLTGRRPCFKQGGAPIIDGDREAQQRAIGKIRAGSMIVPAEA